jgi:hypothetical protein
MYKYVCSVKTFPNCRVHDEGFDDGRLRFFRSFKDVTEELLLTHDREEFGPIYSMQDGQVYAKIQYDFERHHIRGIKTHVPGTNDWNTTKDDGRGNLVWENPIIEEVSNV